MSQDGDLKLHSDARAPVAIPTARDGYGVVAQATRDLVAVMDRDDRTRVYDVSSGTARLVDTVAGGGVLAPYGDHLVSVALARDDSSSVLLWTAGGDTVPLPVPGQPQTRGAGPTTTPRWSRRTTGRARRCTGARWAARSAPACPSTASRTLTLAR